MRARQYLSRVQYLHFDVFPGESTLLTAISSLVQSFPICPNLQKIFLGPGLKYPAMVYNITLLISPTLSSIIFANTIVDTPGIAAISTLLNLLKCYGVRLHEISYRGPVSSLFAQCISGLSTLRSVTIQPDRPGTGGDIQPLHGLENLTTLNIHLGIFQAGVSVGDWLVRLPSLLTLSLSGSWEGVNGCILNKSYKFLQSLSLFLDAPAGNVLGAQYMGPAVFASISLAFPELRSLNLALNDNPVVHGVVTVSDVLALRERSLEVLELRNLPATLSTTQLIDILAAWPLLKRLCIRPAAAYHFVCDGNAVLSYMSNHASKLQVVDLPLDFSALTTALLSSPSDCRCPLQVLNISQAHNLPEAFHGKLTLCRNLIYLLPRLNDVTSPGSNSGVTGDLQTAINLVQDMLSYPPKRHDHLF